MNLRWTSLLPAVAMLFVFLQTGMGQTIPKEKMQGAEGIFMISGIPLERDEQGRVVEITLSGNLVRNEVLELLPQFPHIERLSLQKESLDEMELDPLLKLPKLKVLDLSGQLTDGSMEVIGGMAGLEELSVSRTKISDAGMADIGSLSRLRSLTLYSVDFTDSGIAQISRLKNLRELHIYNAPLTDERLEVILEIAGLEALTMENVAITKNGFARLARLKNLRELYVGSYYLRFLPENLSEFTNLRSLTLDAPLTDDGLENLRLLPALESLTLKDTKITDAGLKEIAKCKKLKYLGLADEKISNAGLKIISTHFQQLEGLGLEYLPITRRGLSHLAAMPRLRRLVLKGTWLCDRDLSVLADLAHLEELELEAGEATEHGLGHLTKCIGLKRLVVIFPPASRECLQKLRRALPKCEIIAEEVYDE